MRSRYVYVGDSTEWEVTTAGVFACLRPRSAWLHLRWFDTYSGKPKLRFILFLDLFALENWSADPFSSSALWDCIMLEDTEDTNKKLGH